MRMLFRRVLRAALPVQPPAEVPRSAPCVSRAAGGYYAHGPNGVCGFVCLLWAVLATPAQIEQNLRQIERQSKEG